jgi:hypothetical protein
LSDRRHVQKTMREESHIEEIYTSFFLTSMIEIRTLSSLQRLSLNITFQDIITFRIEVSDLIYLTVFYLRKEKDKKRRSQRL